MQIKRLLASLIVLTGLSLTLVSAAASLTANISPRKVFVVYGDQAPWIYKHSAEELSKYIKEITGTEIKIVKDNNPLIKKAKNLILIGDSAHNRIIKELKYRGKFTFPGEIAGTDGFVVKSLKDKGKSYLILAGADNRGTLYSVYGYLRKYCQVGFFLDGERVPKQDKVPFFNINLMEKPRFPLRFHSIPPWRGMNKYQSTSWNLSDYKNFLDSLAKQKINATNIPLPLSALLRITSAKLGYPLPPEKDEAIYHAGWPAGWHWPEEYELNLTREVINYARKLGMKFVYGFRYGVVPSTFKEKYPQFKYKTIGGYGTPQFAPDEPMLQKFMKKEIEVAIDLFGKPNWYFSGIYSEATPGGSIEASSRIKAKAGERFTELLRSLDPEAVFIVDTWAYSKVPSENSGYKYTIKNYLATFKKDAFLTYDTSAESRTVPFYKEYNYFYGKNWTFGVLNSMSSSDNPHGDMKEVMKRIQAVSVNPKATNLQGVWMVPEMSNGNIAYFHLVSQLAWNPEGVTLNKFFKEYVRHRYGVGDAKEMLKAWELLHYSVYGKFFEGKDYGNPRLGYYTTNSPFYKFPAMGFGNPLAFPLFTNKKQEKIREDYLRDIPKVVPPLEQALEILLSQKESQKGNILYNNDLITFTKYYLGQVSNWYLIKAYESFRNKDKAGLDKNARIVNESLLGIQKILHTRKDYSLQETIKKAMEVKGANTYLPEMIRKSAQNADYLNQDNYEQLFYYRDMVDTYLAKLKSRLGRGQKTISRSMLKYRWKKIGEKWVKTPFSPFKVEGKTVPVVTEVFKQMKGYGRDIR